MNSDSTLEDHFTLSGMDGNMNSEDSNADLNRFFNGLTPGMHGTYPFQTGFTPGGQMFEGEAMDFFPSQSAMLPGVSNDRFQPNFWAGDDYPFPSQQSVDPDVIMAFHHGVPPANSFHGVTDDSNPLAEPGNPLSNYEGQTNIEQPPASISQKKHQFEDDLEQAPPAKLKRRRQSKKKPLSEEQQEEKRGKFLERNREAAKKCRSRKTEWVQDLQNKQQMLSHDNSLRKLEVEGLRTEIAEVLKLIHQHKSLGCTAFDELLAQYTARQASVQLYGTSPSMKVGDFQGSDMASPTNLMSAPMSRGNSSPGVANLRTRPPASMNSPGFFTQPMSRDGSTSSVMNATQAMGLSGMHNWNNMPLESLYKIARDPSLDFSNKELKILKEQIRAKEEEKRQAMRQYASSTMANDQELGQPYHSMSRQNSVESGQHDSGFSSMGTPEKVKDILSPTDAASTTPSMPLIAAATAEIGHSYMKGNPRLPYPVGPPGLDPQLLIEQPR